METCTGHLPAATGALESSFDKDKHLSLQSLDSGGVGDSESVQEQASAELRPGSLEVNGVGVGVMAFGPDVISDRRTD